MRCFVTGAAGFIGSNLVTRLLELGHSVVGYDNLSTGHKEFTEYPVREAIGQYEFFKEDLFSTGRLAHVMQGCDIVFHLAANADVRYGSEHPDLDIEQNIIGTQYVLEAMYENNIRRIVFTSTASVYGEPSVFPTPENAPFPIQTSLYGASKLAAEGLIQAYCETFGFQAYIFRLVSVLGERYSHGHVFDFYKQLKEHPDRLDVLGNGNVVKAYIYVKDVIEAIERGINFSFDPINIFNVSPNWTIAVRNAAPVTAECMGLKPKINFGEGWRGWIGDNRRVQLDCTKLKALRWFPTLNYYEMVSRTVNYLKENEWLLNTR